MCCSGNRRCGACSGSSGSASGLSLGSGLSLAALSGTDASVRQVYLTIPAFLWEDDQEEDSSCGCSCGCGNSCSWNCCRCC